jgi:hypothetical protein
MSTFLRVAPEVFFGRTREEVACMAVPLGLSTSKRIMRAIKCEVRRLQSEAR